MSEELNFRPATDTECLEINLSQKTTVDAGPGFEKIMYYTTIVYEFKNKWAWYVIYDPKHDKVEWIISDSLDPRGVNWASHALDKWLFERGRK